MLSISMVGKFRCTKPSRMTGDANKDAITFIAQLSKNEETLIQQTKLLLKKDKEYCKRVLSTSVDGWAPFHVCVMRGSLKLIKLAFKSGVSANLEMGESEDLPYKNCSPLHLAAHRGDTSIIQFLVQHGSIVNKRDGSNHAPIYYAVNAKNTLAVKKLLKYGSDTCEMTPTQRRHYYDVTEHHAPALLCLPTRSSGSVRGRNGSIRGHRDS